MSDEGIEFTQVTASRLLRYLSYPSEWLQSGLYPEDMARGQLRHVLEHLNLDQVVFERLPDDCCYGS